MATLCDIAAATKAKLTGDGSTAAEQIEVLDVTHDSRQARAGTLFVAIRGAQFDAHRFVAEAMQRGVVGVISEQPRPENFNGAWLEVNDARRAMAIAAAEVFRHPSKELRLVGITGTNGKTTVAYLVAAIVKAAKECVAMTGTVEYVIGDEHLKAERTTPEATDMQRFLRRAVEANCRTAVMECSSQAIDLHRCDELFFSVAVFTNLTRDHLDYHGTMENYFAAKRRLFDASLAAPPRVAVINIDDAYGRKLIRETNTNETKLLTYGLDASADVSAHDIEFSLEGMIFRVRTQAGERAFQSPLVGRPHLYNTLAAIATGLELGYNLDVIAEGLRDCAGAPGRFERVAHAGDFSVVVDYAHTDDALINVLRTARDVAPKRILTVFGCGGDRDRSKRAPMGEAAASLSDVVILTSDNPRTEDPARILEDVEKGMIATHKPYEKIPDRRLAIHRAINEAGAGDLVLIAGKGHEDYQIIGQDVFHFDDKEIAREALAARAQTFN